MSTMLQDLDPLEEEWLTMEDVRRYFAVSRDTARKITRRPGFPIFRHERLRRIPKAAFLRWVAAQTGQDPATAVLHEAHDGVTAT